MQSSLFFEDINDALREVVRSLGGAKKVGLMLWPEKSMEQAQQLLLACLNNERRERLDPDQLLFLLREARRANCHAAMNYIASETGYACQPIEPEDERAKLQRDVIEAAQMFRTCVDRLERLTQVAPAPGLQAVK